MSNVLVFAEHLHGKFPKTTLVGARRRQDARREERRQVRWPSSSARASTRLASELADVRRQDVVAVDDAALEHYVADAYAAALADVVKQKGVEDVVATATARRQGPAAARRRAARRRHGVATSAASSTATHLRAADVRRQRLRHGQGRGRARA